MDYPQHLCVVSRDDPFRHMVSGHFAPLGMTLQWLESFDRLLVSGLPQEACLLVDADLALNDAAPSGVKSLRRQLDDYFSNRPNMTVLVMYREDIRLSGRPPAFYDMIIERANQLLPKPVAIDHLAFALQHVMRMQLQPASEPESEALNWLFDPISMQLLPPVGEGFALSASEARLIAMLITKDPDPVRREDLIELFGIKSPNIRRIDTTVYRLRHKIEQLTGYSAPFSTVHGIGYRNKGLSATVPLSF